MGENSSQGSNKTWVWILIAVIIIIVIVILLLKNCNGVKEYSINFNSNGGSAVAAMTVKEDGTIQRPSDPTRDGYEFDGWYYNGELFDFSTKVTKDITLEARWKETTQEPGIKLSSTALTLSVNDTDKLTATLTGGLTGKLIWTSSDEKIVSVDENGNVKALKKGSATITVKTEDGSYSATCTITVKEEATSLKLTISGSKTVEEGSTITLKANVTPKDAKIVWKSGNTSIATVDENGNVKGIKAGTATITATATDNDGNNKTASVKITVTAKESEKPKEELKVTIGGTKTVKVESKTTLKTTVTPTGTNVTYTWEILEGTANISVDKTNAANIVITGVKAGTAKVKVTVKDSEGNVATETVTITVEDLEYTYEIETLTTVLGEENVIAVRFYYGTREITSQVRAVYSAPGSSLGGSFSTEQDAWVINKTKADRINYIRIPGVNDLIPVKKK